jgi:hypothetical protein
MIKIDVCQECGKRDILGYVACVNKNLCPDCGAPYIGMKSEILREFLNTRINK